MTALDRYQRLESDAIWRPDASAQRRDVVVCFRDATLIIMDGAGRPLSHWSLPAVIRLTHDGPAQFTPDPSESEILEIADPTMVDAIEQVRAALVAAQPKPGRLRFWLGSAVALTIMLLGFLWLPQALLNQTVTVVPDAKRAEIGDGVLRAMTPRTGRICGTRQGAAALDQLTDRVFGAESPVKVAVLPQLPPQTVSLPGDIILLGADVMRSADDPAAVAGFLIQAQVQTQHVHPIEHLLTLAGLAATVQLLVSGDIPKSAVIGYADHILNTRPIEIDGSMIAAMAKALDDAQIPAGPFLATHDRLNGSMPDFPTGPAVAFPPVLNDSAWVALQNICNG